MAARTDATPMRRIKQATKKNEDRKKMVRRLKKKSKQTFEAVYVVLFVLLCIAGSLGVARRMSLPASVVSFASVAHQPQNTRVYLDVRVDGQHAGRLEVELFDGLAPKTAANFRALCVGAGQTSYGLSKTYVGSAFHRIIPNFVAQGGEYTLGRGGESIYEGNEFADEWDNGMLRHDRRGLLSMANAGPDTQTSQFFLTLGATGALDGKHVVFGVVARGLAVLDAIEAGGTSSGAPVKRVVISAAGAL